MTCSRSKDCTLFGKETSNKRPRRSPMSVHRSVGLILILWTSAAFCGSQSDDAKLLFSRGSQQSELNVLSPFVLCAHIKLGNTNVACEGEATLLLLSPDQYRQ